MYTQVRRNSEQSGSAGVHERPSMRAAAQAAVLVVRVLVALLVGPALGPRAVAAEILHFQSPFAQARVFGRETGPTRATDWRMDGDFHQNEIAPKHALAGVPTASAFASASLLQQAPHPRFGLVSARLDRSARRLAARSRRTSE